MEEQEERIRIGLIQYLADHPLDEDYGWVSRNAPGTGGRRARVVAGIVLAVFAVLVVTAASQTTRNSGSEEQERQELITQVKARRASLDQRRDEQASLTASNRSLQRAYAAGDKSGAALFARVDRLSVLSGAVAVRGPGVRVVADDAKDASSDRERVLDRDLQRLVNGLFAAGAEAISVNGQRITNLTAIRQAGGAINVNYVPLTAPYTLLVIGDSRTLASRFADSTSGAAWFDLVRQVGLRLDISSAGSLRVPAVSRIQLRYAVRAKGATS
ncbi:MAG: hypothetical protein JWO46_3268 [Nocardioidaceae bacterium]|nr:hypothetical protein [Nocardioidaceae bacterium]